MFEKLSFADHQKARELAREYAATGDDETRDRLMDLIYRPHPDLGIRFAYPSGQTTALFPDAADVWSVS